MDISLADDEVQVTVKHNGGKRCCPQCGKTVRQSSLRTARAWAMKEFASTLWKYKSPGWALKGWRRLLGWMARSRLKPMKDAWGTLKKHLWGIIDAVLLGAHNSRAEIINSRIKMIKNRARGFRNKERFRHAIYFHLGELQLYPPGIKQ